MAERVTYMSSISVRQVRQALGWSQVEMAEHVGYTRWAVSQWETGSQPVPAAVALLLEIWYEHPHLVRMPRPGGVAF